MRRRTYLAGCVGLAGSLAGCSGILGDSGGGSGNAGDDPAATVEAFYEAALAGNGDEARSYFHAEAQFAPPPEEGIQQAAESTLRLEGTEVVEQGNGSAIVVATISQEHPDTGERVEGTERFELRTEGGQWRIYDQPLPPSEGPSSPSVAWDVTERTENGAVTAVVFEHGGGDTVDSTTLSATVAGSTVRSPETASDVQTANRAVVPFDSGGDAVGSGGSVELVWTDPDGGASRILATFTLTTETAGAPADRLRIE